MFVAPFTSMGRDKTSMSVKVLLPAGSIVSLSLNAGKSHNTIKNSFLVHLLFYLRNYIHRQKYDYFSNFVYKYQYFIENETKIILISLFSFLFVCCIEISSYCSDGAENCFFTCLSAGICNQKKNARQNVF